MIIRATVLEIKKYICNGLSAQKFKIKFNLQHFHFNILAGFQLRYINVLLECEKPCKSCNWYSKYSKHLNVTTFLHFSGGKDDRKLLVNRFVHKFN